MAATIWKPNKNGHYLECCSRYVKVSKSYPQYKILIYVLKCKTIENTKDKEKTAKNTEKNGLKNRL